MLAWQIAHDDDASPNSDSDAATKKRPSSPDIEVQVLRADEGPAGREKQQQGKDGITKGPTKRYAELRSALLGRAWGWVMPGWVGRGAEPASRMALLMSDPAPTRHRFAGRMGTGAIVSPEFAMASSPLGRMRLDSNGDTVVV